MNHTKKKRTSVFSVLVVIVLLLTVALTITANVFFSGNMIPQAGGYYLYLHEESDMQPDIEENSLVVARNSDYVSLTAGNKVLCYLTNGNVALRLIYLINLNEDNSTSYFVGTPEEQGSEPAIPKDNIFGVCVWSSTQLYQYVKFATSITGLLALLVLPCVILIIMLLVKIVKSNQEEPEQIFEPEEELPSFEEAKPVMRAKPITPEDEFFNQPLNHESRRRRTSTQDRSSSVPVREDVPETQPKEQTTKFDVPDKEETKKADTEPVSEKNPVAPPDFGTKTPQETPVQYIQKEPPAQPTIKPQPFQPYQPPQAMPMPPMQSAVPPMSQPVQMPVPPIQQPVQPVPPVPVVDISKVQPVQSQQAQTSEEIRSTALEREKARVRESRKESSPNIDDILMASRMRDEIRSSSKTSNSEIARTDSIDDLIAVLEKKKNNL